MERLSLNGIWTLRTRTFPEMTGTVPGSLYSFLLDKGLIEDPYYRENELDALPLSEEDCVFLRSFKAPEDFLHKLRLRSTWSIR